MKKLLIAFFLSTCAFAASNVQQSIYQLGNTNTWVLAYNWTADTGGNVTPTLGQLATCCQGYNVSVVEIVPGTPSPTAGYAVAIQDGAGVDVLGGAAVALSATAAQSYPASPAATPIQGALKLVITGQSVNSAKGIVYVFLSKPGQINAFNIGRNPSVATGYVLDANAITNGGAPYPALSAACTAANAVGATLVVSLRWNTLLTQSLPCPLFFLAGGIIQPASGQTITISPKLTCGTYQQCFDTSASGSAIAFSAGAPNLNPNWWGADYTGSLDSASAIKAALAASLEVSFPPGTYLSSTAIPISTNGQHIYCAGSGYQGTSPALLRFTGATDGFQGGDTNNIEIDDCMFQAANAGAGKAINFTTTTGAGHKLFRLSFFNSGSGSWTHGIYLSGAIAVQIYSPYCFSIDRCYSANSQANAVDIFAPLVGGHGTTAIEINGSLANNVHGGTVEGDYVALGTVDGSSTSTWDSTYLESSGSNANMFTSAGDVTLRNITLGGGSVTGPAFHFTGTGSPTIDGLYGFVSTPDCMIQADGNSANTAHSVVIQNLRAFNASSASGSHSVCIGTGSTGWWAASITGSYLQSHDTAVVAKGAAGLITIGPGNAFNSSSFGVDASAANLIKIDGNNFPSTAGACTGCKMSNMLFPSNNVLNNTQQFSLPGGLPAFADLPSCNQFLSGISGYWISDSTTNTIGNAVAGGGGNTVAVGCVHSGGGTGSWTVTGK